MKMTNDSFKEREWLTSTQIKGFFSRLSVARRRQVPVSNVDTTSVECELKELQEHEEEEARQELFSLGNLLVASCYLRVQCRVSRIKCRV